MLISGMGAEVKLPPRRNMAAGMEPRKVTVLDRITSLCRFSRERAWERKGHLRTGLLTCYLKDIFKAIEVPGPLPWRWYSSFFGLLDVPDGARLRV